MEQMSRMGEMPPAIIGAISEISAFSTELLGELVKALNWKPAPGAPTMPSSGISFVATNVPGPQTPWYFAGHKVTDMMGLLPLGGNLGYGVGISSYDRNILFSMMADGRLMPDVEQMKTFVREAFEDLRQRVPAAGADAPPAKNSPPRAA